MGPIRYPEKWPSKMLSLQMSNSQEATEVGHKNVPCRGPTTKNIGSQMLPFETHHKHQDHTSHGLLLTQIKSVGHIKADSFLEDKILLC